MNLLPRPNRLEPAAGTLTLTPDTAIAAPPEARAPAELLAGWLRTATGWPVPIRAAGPAAFAFVAHDGPGKGPESYLVDITPTGATMTAPQPAGWFHAAQTIRQLLSPMVEGVSPVPTMEWHPMTWTLPCLALKDHPRFGWRGFLIDSGRHFLPVETVKRVVDALALYKMNRLHWHLTEDQGWRLAIAKYPKLTEVGAWRGPTRYGGFYTREDIQSVVAYATARNVEVVPEIELPGHAQAALAAYPHLGCTGGPYEVATKWGIFEDVYCAGNDQVFEFLEAVLTEVCDLFPGRAIHLGADECPKVRWKACPKCQARIKKEGLKDEHALQTWFVHRIIRFLETKGKRSICWDEILEGGPPPGVIVQAWRANEKAVSKAVAAGHEVIHSPYSHVYLNETQAWCTLEHVWGWDPLVEGDKKDLTPAVLPRPELLIGGEGCLWGEWCPPNRIGWQAFPRLLAVAERLWSKDEGRDWTEFHARALAQADRLSYLGLTPGPEQISGS